MPGSDIADFRHTHLSASRPSTRGVRGGWGEPAVCNALTKHQHRYVKKLTGSQYVIDAGIRTSDLEALVNFPFPDGDFVTLGGLVYHELGRIPSVGDEVLMNGGRLEVLEMDKHRITKVLFQDTATGADGTVRLAEEDSVAGDASDGEEPAPEPELATGT